MEHPKFARLGAVSLLYLYGFPVHPKNGRGGSLRKGVRQCNQLHSNSYRVHSSDQVAVSFTPEPSSWLVAVHKKHCFHAAMVQTPSAEFAMGGAQIVFGASFLVERFALSFSTEALIKIDGRARNRDGSRR
jgi:hypothetical protein